MKEKISVIIPVYNTEKYLEKCIQSVLDQTYTNLEIICVDDGSTDGSGAILDEFAEKDKRIKVIHKVNGGLVSARKAGVVLATGEYTSYVDSDDWIDSDIYEKLVKAIQEEHPDIVLFGSKKEYPNRTEVRKETFAAGMYYREQFEELVSAHIQNCEYFYTPIVVQYLVSKLFKTELIREEQLKVYDEISLGEDCLSYACILKSKKVLVMDIQPYHYRVRQDSIVHNKNSYDKCLCLIQYLNLIMGNIEYLRPLLIQCIYYQLSLVDVSKIMFFPQIGKKDRIVIYGKGVMASVLEKMIRERRLCKVVNWVDSGSIEELKRMQPYEYDYVVIAITVHEIVRKVEKLLELNEIPSQKIIRIKPRDLVEENLPEEIKVIIKGE